MTAVDTVRATTATLVATRAVGAYHRCSLVAPDIVAAAVPGQFVSVAVGVPGALLRRPFAVAGVDADAGTVDLVVAVVGRGTAWLVAQPASTVITVTGPHGRGFVTPGTPTDCVLVGGGYGVAALEWLGRRLAARGHGVELLSGAVTADRLYPVSRLDPDAVTVTETTEDGSRGRRGLVTDALGERLAGDGVAVFACGPMPMLAAVARLASAHRRPCQVAVEEHMGCSVGVCMTCVVPTIDGYVRACVEGPVMDAGRIAWDALAGGDAP